MLDLAMAREDVQTNLRIPADLKDLLQEAARKSGRSLSAEVAFRLQESFAVDKQVLMHAAADLNEKMDYVDQIRIQYEEQRRVAEENQRRLEESQEEIFKNMATLVETVHKVERLKATLEEHLASSGSTKKSKR